MNGTLDKVLTLRRIHLFKGLPFEELVTLGRIATITHAAAGSTIFTQGEPGTTLYVVLSGEVQISRDAKDGPQKIAGVRPGGYFGEMALLDDRPRSATARAVQNVILLQIQKTQFRALVAGHVNLALELLRTFALRIRQTGETHE